MNLHGPTNTSATLISVQPYKLFTAWLQLKVLKTKCMCVVYYVKKKADCIDKVTNLIYILLISENRNKSLDKRSS